MINGLRDILLENKNTNKVAIKHKNQTITYYQLYEQVLVHYKQMKQYIDSYKNVGIFLPNSIDYAIAFFSINFANGIIVPLLVESKSLELINMIKYCELKLIITNNKYSPYLAKMVNESPFETTIYNLDDGSFYIINKGRQNLEQYSTVEKDIALMIHTSGSLSSPKRVMLSEDNLISNINSITESLGLKKNDKTLIALPMQLASANTSQFLSHLYLGASIVLMDDIFIPNIFSRIINEEKITNFTGVPSMMYLILNNNVSSKIDFSSLKFICFGGGPTPVDRIEALLNRFPNVDFVHMYGQTEATTRITHLLPNNFTRKIGSVGKPLPGISIKLVNEKGQNVGVGEIGEILVKGNNVMKGYYKNPKETAQTIINGWLYTGDLAYFDNEGFLYIKGRKKNVINTSGYNVYPEEVEELLLSNSEIVEAKVLSQKHEIYGEIPIAEVVLKKQSKATESDIISYCSNNLANYKIPVKIIFVSSINKTVTGKIKRGNLS